MAPLGPDKEGAALEQLEMRSLQLQPLAADGRPILAPVELKGLARLDIMGTNVSRPAVCCSRCRCSFQLRANAATRPYDPSNPSATRSACNCLTVRLCLRGRPLSSLSQLDSLAANASSLLGRSGSLNAGSTTSPRTYLRMVFRDSPVLRAISRIESWSRSAQRRITLSNSMPIAPVTPAETARARSKHGSNLGGNFARTWVSSRCNSTPVCPF